jgi:hypothetical protein
MPTQLPILRPVSGSEDRRRCPAQADSTISNGQREKENSEAGPQGANGWLRLQALDVATREGKDCRRTQPRPGSPPPGEAAWADRGRVTPYWDAGVDGLGQWGPVQQRGLLLLGLGLATGARVSIPEARRVRRSSDVDGADTLLWMNREATRSAMNVQRVLALVGIGFGIVFVAVNARSLPSPGPILAIAAAVPLTAAALWFGVAHARPASAVRSGSVRAYWLAVAGEAVAIPAGAIALHRINGNSDLVVLWVVFVVGAHFIPAKAFGVGRYAELGAALMGIAVVFGILRLVGHIESAPATGGVLAGLSLLTFSAIPALSWSPENVGSGRGRVE